MLQGALIGCGFFAPAACMPGPGTRARASSRSATATPIAWRRPPRPSASSGPYADAAEMLHAKDLDFVDIATTAPSHRPLVELASGGC